MKKGKNNKITSLKFQLVKSIYIFTGFLLFFVFFGCTSTQNKTAGVTPHKQEETYQAEPYYIDLQEYEKIKKSRDIDFLGEKPVILELTEQAESLYTLRGSEAVSFTVATMPKDLKIILQKYKKATGEDFYTYVIEHTDRFILSPDLKLFTVPVAGASITKSGTRVLYLGENITLLNTRLDFFSDWYIAKVMVHEAAHHKLNMLIQEGKLSTEYYRLELTERHSHIIELEFLYALIWGPKSASEYNKIKFLIRQCEIDIEKYNVQLGLEPDNRTLLPR